MFTLIPTVNVIKWTAVDYIHPSYNTLIKSTSTRVDISELCERRFQHSRDTTSRHWVELTVTSCICVWGLLHFVLWVNYLKTLKFQQSQFWFPGFYQYTDDSSESVTSLLAPISSQTWSGACQPLSSLVSPTPISSLFNGCPGWIFDFTELVGEICHILDAKIIPWSTWFSVC